MTVTMDIDAHNDLMQLINNFAIAGRKPTLREFQCIAGHVNWAFNVFSLLKPGLLAIYFKTAGKNRDLATIQVNTIIVHKLSWVACHIACSFGIHFLKSVKWDPRNTELHAFSVSTDTSGVGLGCFLPSLKLVFQCTLPSVCASKHIFFFEALAICSVFHYFTQHPPGLSHNHLVVYTDSTNIVDILNSLRASGPYNCILISSMDVALDHEVDFGILHIHSVDNPIADAISHSKNNLAVSLCLGLVIQNFKPPQDALGVVQK
jgi:hypothetical protein